MQNKQRPAFHKAGRILFDNAFFQNDIGIGGAFSAHDYSVAFIFDTLIKLESFYKPPIDFSYGYQKHTDLV